jgi:hypothetical protein
MAHVDPRRVSHGFPLLARPPLISFVFIGKIYEQWVMMSVSKLKKVSVQSIFSVSVEMAAGKHSYRPSTGILVSRVHH